MKSHRIRNGRPPGHSDRIRLLRRPRSPQQFANLGGKHQIRLLAAAAADAIAELRADPMLALTVAVRRRSIEQLDACVERRRERRLCLRFGQHSR